MAFHTKYSNNCAPQKMEVLFFQQTTIKMTWQGMKKSAAPAQCIQSYQLSCILIKLSFRPRATGKSNRLISHFLEGGWSEQIFISPRSFEIEVSYMNSWRHHNSNALDTLIKTLPFKHKLRLTWNQNQLKKIRIDFKNPLSSFSSMKMGLMWSGKTGDVRDIHHHCPGRWRRL